MNDGTYNVYSRLRRVSPDIVRDINPLLLEGEEILFAYKGLHDYCAFTSNRIIAVYVPGTTGKKRSYCNIPYTKIDAYSVETLNALDVDSELTLHCTNIGIVRFGFVGKNEILEIAQMISAIIL